MFSFFGIVFYFIVSAFHTLCFALSGQRRYLLQSWPRPLQLAHAVFYATIVCYPFLVTIAFWSVLSDPSSVATVRSRFSNITVHALNSFLALLELLVFTRTKSTTTAWSQLFFLVLFLALYLGLAYGKFNTFSFALLLVQENRSVTSHLTYPYLAWEYLVTKATQNFYVYSFLDPHKEKGSPLHSNPLIIVAFGFVLTSFFKSYRSRCSIRFCNCSLFSFFSHLVSFLRN
jgi:hypothetical protein